MEKLQKSNFYSTLDSSSYHFTLKKNDIFISLQTNLEIFSVWLSGHEIKHKIEDFFIEALKYLKADFGKIECKVICNSETSKLIKDYIKKPFKLKKEVLRENDCEIIYIPSLLKIKAAIEDRVEIKLPNKDSRIKSKVKVLIVDDSTTIQNILSRVFKTNDDFEVVAMAKKPSEVESLIIKHNPDVITLDIHMPEMDGVTLLKTIIAPKYQVPTVMISSISMSEGPMVLDALENGAFDYIQKPDMKELANITPLILEKVKAAAMSKKSIPQLQKRKTSLKVTDHCNMDSLIVLGASTGGTEAIRQILTALPNQIPPILIVQHIPAVFSMAFAKRMNELCPFEVKEAKNGDEILPNQVLIAPGGTQMKMIQKGNKAFIEVNNDEPVNRFKPSVDYLFNSVSKSLYTHTIGVLLTGMGKDGARGLKQLKDLGVQTIAQNEESSIVFGMPKEAIEIGGATHVEHLDDIAKKITELTHINRSKKQAAS